VKRIVLKVQKTDARTRRPRPA